MLLSGWTPCKQICFSLTPRLMMCNQTSVNSRLASRNQKCRSYQKAVCMSKKSHLEARPRSRPRFHLSPPVTAPHFHRQIRTCLCCLCLWCQRQQIWLRCPLLGSQSCRRLSTFGCASLHTKRSRRVALFQPISPPALFLRIKRGPRDFDRDFVDRRGNH